MHRKNHLNQGQENTLGNTVRQNYIIPLGPFS